MRENLGRRIALLETKTKPRMLSAWIDRVLWLDEHEGDDGKLEVAHSPRLKKLVEMASNNSLGLHGEMNDRFGPNTREGCLDQCAEKLKQEKAFLRKLLADRLTGISSMSLI
jgi:hypothetical protein